MKIEFEEKDFEAPLYSELRFGSHRIATPGQVFEGKYGIDAALEAEHPLFWNLFGYYEVPTGVILNDLRWGFVWRKLGKKRRLPTFSVNVLVQAKRPEVLSRATLLLKSYGFKSKYWRFEVTKHQHEILGKVAKRLKRRALVVYASPAFDTLEDLYDFTEAQTVVKNSSFVKVEAMIDHEKWNYHCPGTLGVAHSDPELIEDPPFYSMLELLREESGQFESHSDNLRFLHESVLSVSHELQEENPVARYYLRLYGRLRRLEEVYELEETLDYVAFNLFCNVVGAKWLVG